MATSLSIPAGPSATARWPWLAALDPGDPRYPRAGWAGLLRWVARFWWLPISAYVGNCASNLVALAAQRGMGALGDAPALERAVLPAPVLAFVAARPYVLAAALLVVALLSLLGRAVWRDQRREVAVLRLRDVMRLRDLREGGTALAERLGQEVAELQREIVAREAQLAPAAPGDAALTPGPSPVRGRGEAGGGLRDRAARLAELSEWLGRDARMREMVFGALGTRLIGWERRQNALTVAVGGVSVVASWLVSALANPATLGGLLQR